MFARVRKGGKRGKDKKKDGNKKKHNPPDAVVREARRGGEMVVSRGEALERVEKKDAGVSGKSGDNALRTEARSVGITVTKMFAHLIVLLVFIGLGIGAHFVIKDIYGDPTILDRIPVRYAVDLADVAIVLTLAVVLIRSILGLDKKQR